MPSLNSTSASADEIVLSQLPLHVVSATQAACVESRHTIARDAVSQNKPFAAEAVAQYLTTLSSTFADYALREPANGLLDSKVLEAIDAFRPSLDQYRQLVQVIAKSDTATQMVVHFVPFFRDVLRFKQNDATAQQCVLWSDGYRFLLREMFLTTCAIFIDSDAYAAATVLLESDYSTDDESPALRFTVFDGYAKTLDEFRNRRLQLQRMSVSSDIMRERADASVCSFEALMQADFVLSLRSLVCEPSFFVRWYPRLLVCADEFALSGFDLFVRGIDAAHFGPLATMLAVDDWATLLQRFDSVCQAWALERWEVGGAPLNFRGFMGLNSRVLRH